MTRWRPERMGRRCLLALAVLLVTVTATTPAAAESDSAWRWLVAAEARAGAYDLHVTAAKTVRQELEGLLPADFLSSPVLTRDLFIALVARGAFDLSRDRALELKQVIGSMKAGPPGPLVAELLRRLGAGYEKLGQFLGNRPDLVAAAHRDALAELSDRAARLSEYEVRRQIARSLVKNPRIRALAGLAGDASLADLSGRRQDAVIAVVFKSIDPSPLGTGSIAQAHLATLQTGEPIVIKVVKPQAAGDLERNFAGFDEVLAGDEHRTVRDLLAEIRRQSERETALGHEAGALRRARRALARRRIEVPAVIDGLGDEHVLFMELAPGAKITKLTSPAARRQAADRLFRAVVYLSFLTAEFHGDPHEGNVFASEADGAGHGGELALIDFGLTAGLTGKDKTQLLGFFAAEASGSTRLIVRALRPWADGVSDDALRDLVAQRSGTSALERTQKLLLDLQLAGASIPPNVLAASKSLLLAEGVARKLDPSFVVERTLGSLWREAIGTRLRGAPSRRRSIEHLLDEAEIARFDEVHARVDHEVAVRVAKLATTTGLRATDLEAYDGSNRAGRALDDDLKELRAIEEALGKLPAAPVGERFRAQQAAWRETRSLLPEVLRLQDQTLGQLELVADGATSAKRDLPAERRTVQARLAELTDLADAARDPRLGPVRDRQARDHGLLAARWRREAEARIEFATTQVEQSAAHLARYRSAYDRTLPSPATAALAAYATAWQERVAVEERLLASPFATSDRPLREARRQRDEALRLERGFLGRASPDARTANQVSARFDAVTEALRGSHRALLPALGHERVKEAIRRVRETER